MKSTPEEKQARTVNFKPYVEGNGLYLVKRTYFSHEEMNDLEIFLNSKPKITVLMLYTNHLHEEDFLVFARNKTLKSLILLHHYPQKNGFKMTNKAVELVCQNTTLEHLEIDSQDLGADAAKILAKSHFKKITLGNNQIGDNGAKAIAKNNSLRELRISDLSIGTEGVLALADNTNLTRLRISVRKIDCQTLARLGKNPSLRHLELIQNHIGDDEAIALAKSIPRNTQLKTLDLKINEIGCRGAIALSECPSIVEFNLSYNKIEDRGALAFLKNKKLKSLDLDGNPITKPNLKIINSKIEEYAHLRQNANIVFLAYLGINFQLQNNNATLEGLEDVFLLVMRACNIEMGHYTRQLYYNLLTDFRSLNFFKNNEKTQPVSIIEEKSGPKLNFTSRTS